ncbi:MAG: NFACT family protein [Oscillospiraceae bacterium]|jgi:predicted ribosome quality control (RQC) complex YloA/Tae2 family protein|nr:NFACT family protein [Oscillospiraceae bacterium]
MDGVAMGFMCAECRAMLRGGRVDQVRQPDRSTMILVMRSHGANHRLLLSADANNARIQLTGSNPPNPPEPPMFCMLLRKRLAGAVIADIRAIGGDRVAWIDFDTEDELGERGSHRLIVECMGRHSNIILLDGTGRIVDSIRRVGAEVNRYRELLPGVIYQPPPSQDKLDPAAFRGEAAEEARAALSARMPTGGKLSRGIAETVMGVGAQTAREFAQRVCGDAEAYMDRLNREAAVDALASILRDLPDYADPVSVLDGTGAAVDAFPFGMLSLTADRLRRRATLSEAMDACYAHRDEAERIARRKQSLKKAVGSAIERAEKKLAIQLEAINTRERIEEASRFGELIMGSLYRIPPGATAAAVVDYYQEGAPVVTIPLDERAGAVRSAQQYFKRARKMKAARDAALEQRRLTEDLLVFLRTQEQDLEMCADEAELAEVRATLTKAGVVRAEREARKGKPAKVRLPQSEPYRYQSSDGIEIQVGKTSQQNDRITGAAEGDMTWLHAKDMPGSHVVARHNGELPEKTMGEALMLAAWYSKGRASANVPVDATRRKYVKKPGGAAAGFVTYTNQRTYYVTPDEAVVRALTLLNGRKLKGI